MKRISPSLRRKARSVRLLLLDVDGVLTDGSIVIDGAGREIKRRTRLADHEIARLGDDLADLPVLKKSRCRRRRWLARSAGRG